MTLRDVIKRWEMQVGFTVRSLDTASRGKRINKIDAFQILKKLGGATDEEARKIVDELHASPESEKESA